MQAAISRGIVIRRSKRMEHDIRLTLFLREFGKVLITSKGGLKSQSKLRAIQEPFSEAEYHLYMPENGIYGRLASGQLINSHQYIRHDLEAFTVVSRACELVDILLPFRATSPDVYDILHQLFSDLKDGRSPSLVWLRFTLPLLRVLGHGDHSDRINQELNVDSCEGISEDRPEAIHRCVAYVGSVLEQILPRRLKSTEVEVI